MTVALLVQPPRVPREALVKMLRELLVQAERGELTSFVGAIGFADRCTGRAMSLDVDTNLITLLGELDLVAALLRAVVFIREEQ